METTGKPTSYPVSIESELLTLFNSVSILFKFSCEEYGFGQGYIELRSLEASDQIHGRVFLQVVFVEKVLQVPA